MVDYRPTHTCGELTLSDVGKEVVLSGWVHRRRDFGKLIFIDLRDRFGLTQLLFDEKASEVRNEWVITVRGKVVPRAQKNSHLPTGEIEVAVEEIEILSPARPLPFSISEETCSVDEEVRLTYRYLDMRRKEVAYPLIVRHLVMHHTRNFFHDRGFLEITTPILGKSTPGGARDYLVPSRVHPGCCYALPQSPQMFKQLLMVAGMDRYFQIASCFRDEGSRADRQPEFSQIDVEMSFKKTEDLIQIIEALLVKLFRECLQITIPTPFPHLSHRECLERYGTDKPDLRFGMPLKRLDHIVQRSTCTLFLTSLSEGGCVKGLCVKQGGGISRREIERYIEWVAPFGVKGLAWLKRLPEGNSSSFGKFFSEALLHELFTEADVEMGDLLLVSAAPEERVNQGLDHLRRQIAKERGLIPPEALNFLWVSGFPLFRWNVQEKKMESEHHPFTAPHPEDLSLLDSEPLKVRALAYDLVLNGYELAGGSERIYRSDLQEKIFQLLQLGQEEIQEKFGFFVEALTYGTPPHLGIALGLDRLIMLLTKTENIRDVIPFPKTLRGSDLMMQAPGKIDPLQWKELHLCSENLGPQ